MNLLTNVIAESIRELLASKGVHGRVLVGLAHPGNVGSGDEVLTFILNERQPDFAATPHKGKEQ